jgi:hypothetical protein
VFGSLPLFAENGISSVFFALVGKEDAFEKRPFDLAEDPYRFEEVDLIAEFFILEVACEGVVKDGHGELE